MLLLSASAIYGAPLEEIGEFSDLRKNLEIAGFDGASPLLPITSDQFAFPEPVIKLTPTKDPSIASALSMLCPGLGHTYLDDFKTAGSIFGSTFVTVGAGVAPGSSETFQHNNLITAQNTWFYGIYAAYRDAKVMNGLSTYSYKMPTDSFEDLAAAPFKASVLKKPEVWGGLLGMLALATGLNHFIFNKEANTQLSLSQASSLFPMVAFPIGIGEEAFFRGYLQSEYCEKLPPMAAIALSSLVFAAAHIPNADKMSPQDQDNYYMFGLPFIATVGGYLGWMTHKNRSLKESVALHAWYDFVIFASEYAANKAAIDTPAVFSYSTTF